MFTFEGGKKKLEIVQEKKRFVTTCCLSPSSSSALLLQYWAQKTATPAKAKQQAYHNNVKLLLRKRKWEVTTMKKKMRSDRNIYMKVKTRYRTERKTPLDNLELELSKKKGKLCFDDPLYPHRKKKRGIASQVSPFKEEKRHMTAIAHTNAPDTLATVSRNQKSY